MVDEGTGERGVALTVASGAVAGGRLLTQPATASENMIDSTVARTIGRIRGLQWQVFAAKISEV